MSRNLSRLHVLPFLLTLLAPTTSWACACGCGLFDVGTSGMFPTSSGGMAFVEYDYLDQSQNRSGATSAPAGDNGDKEIRTTFLNVGAKYMFDREWGFQFEVPYWSRYFNTTDDSGGLAAFNHGALGDARINGVYTGFSEDMSTGLTFGLKLPTGDTTYAGFDPDTEIGSGSTDLLLGAYHIFKITADGIWNGFAHINLDQPILSKPGYLPGNEVDAALGVYHGGWTLFGGLRVSPIVDALFAFRGADSGYMADPVDSGYRRLLVSPGVEADMRTVRVFADLEVPVYQYFNGNQLAAPIAYKLTAMYMF